MILEKLERNEFLLDSLNEEELCAVDELFSSEEGDDKYQFSRNDDS